MGHEPGTRISRPSRPNKGKEITMRLRTPVTLAGLMSALLPAFSLLPSLAQAADHLNLEEGLPTKIEDAYPIKQGAIEVQGIAGYDRASPKKPGDGRDRFELTPQVEYGIARNMQLSLSAPYRFGNASDAKQGDFRLNALYNFNTEERVLPAFAVAVGIDKPYGLNSGGTETVVKGILTKSIGPLGDSYIPRRVHLNAAWYHNWNPLSEERSNRYLVGAAYNQPINNDWAMVADVYREQKRERNTAENLAELGVRHQLTPLSVLSVGVGAGLNSDAPKWRVVFGFQHTLGTAPLGM